ncbi:TniQ family protein, partial [Mycobacterium avium subsp. hominissuis]|nr:TniQ family protein [Mycobacterium avium subsp. hominissuis]MBZ4528231.1 TniQ family protein [Mycobacterium avium subsp. hominissuis]MBZ4547442.1 TniQ family protein [Mycobacterium avium subsp. hominissuis]MBZ4557178.1 TniQ family protein [Mycobacterium avium subsp. hominissuis]MBZ4633004.1 TniQ family protein [Mycobacterium avium subsp. hominissuis]
MPPRTLPIRVAPVPGEALESWLGAIARRLETPWGHLLAALEPTPADPPGLVRENLTACLHTREAAAIAHATGIWQAAVEASTLGHYDGHLITVDRSTGRVRSTWKSVRSRFCPQCLRVSNGRWQLSWRLPWIFTCQVHSCLLVDVCPECAMFQRVMPWWLRAHEIPDLCRCSRNIELDGEKRRCLGDLAYAAMPYLARQHPIMLAQCRLSGLLSRSVIDCGIYQAMPTSTLDFLRDVRLLSARMLSMAKLDYIAESLEMRGDSHIREHSAAYGSNLDRWSTPGAFAASAPALVTGLGIMLALDVIGRESVEDAASRLRPLIERAKATGRELTPTLLRCGGPTATMDAVHIRAFEPSFGVLDRMRYGTASCLPRYPRTLTPDSLRSIPTLFWREWSFRLTVGRGTLSVIRPVLSIMLVCHGHQTTVPSAARRLSLSMTDRRFAYMVAELRPHRLWPNILATMMRLADYLRENPSPIDYQRRRLLDYRDLLPAQQWNAIYDNAYHGPGWRNRVGDIARSWLFERISMLPRSAAPFKTTTQYRDAVRAEMIAMFTPALIDALNSAGLQYLSHNNVIGEPLTWAPPFSLINDLELPRPDLNSISVTQVHQLAQDPLMTTAAIARNLAVSADVVRYLLEQFPLVRPTTRRRIRNDPAETRLTKADLLRMYNREGMTLTAIAAEVGVGREAV